MTDEFDGKHCSECGGESFSIVGDEWMKRAYTLCPDHGTKNIATFSRGDRF